MNGNHLDSPCTLNCCKQEIEGGTDWQASSVIGVKNIGKGARLFAKQNQHPTSTKRLQEISSQERIKAFDDVHGVPAVGDEPEDFVSRKLEEMDIEMLLVDDGEQHRIALSQNEEYVQSLRIAFLRAEDFNVCRAANRMAHHFVAKQRLFGTEKLGKDLCLEDLNPKDHQILKTGYLQFLPRADRAGRAIGLIIEKLNTSVDPDYYDIVVSLVPCP